MLPKKQFGIKIAIYLLLFSILDYLPSDYEIHSQKFTLYGRYGKSELHFVGKGLSDARGSQVDNIKLVRTGAYG